MNIVTFDPIFASDMKMETMAFTEITEIMKAQSLPFHYKPHIQD